MIDILHEKPDFYISKRTRELLDEIRCDPESEYLQVFAERFVCSDMIHRWLVEIVKNPSAGYAAASNYEYLADAISEAYLAWKLEKLTVLGI